MWIWSTDVPVVMALDVGERRIGVALGSTESRLARPYTVWQSRGRERDQMQIQNLVKETGAELLVVGLPLQSDGTPSPQAERIRRYVEGMTDLPIPVEFRDETYSTQDAQALLRASGARRQKRRELEDAAAAAVILQGYLDAQETNPGEVGE